jgi:hypothetical protein
MKPEVKVRSTDQDAWLNSILDVITEVDCRDHFSSHLGQPQHAQKIIVANFQKSLLQRLQDNIPRLRWTMEFVIPSANIGHLRN